MTLVEQLERIRRERGLSDERFAALLGVSGNLWVETKKRRLPVRFEMLAAATQVLGPDCPEIERAVIDYLRTAPRRREAMALGA